MGPTIAGEDAQFRVLRSIEKNPEATQRELARLSGISLGALNYVLKALVAKGCVKLENFSKAEDKRRYSYILTPSGLHTKAQLTKRFLVRKLEQYETLKAEIEAIQAEIESSRAHNQGKAKLTHKL